MRLTESELKQVVEAAVRKILVKEGLGKWASDKFDDAFRGYKVREGNPQSVLDVIKGNGWTYNEENPFDIQTKTIKVQKATGAFGGHYGLSIEELIEDINIFLNGKGRASLKGKTKPYEYEIYVNAPINIIQGNSMNESIYGDDGFESTSTMEVKQMTPEEINELFWMIEDKGDHNEDGHHIFLSPGIIYNGDEMDTIFSSDLMRENKVSVHGKKSSYEFDELPYNIQQQIFQDVNEYEPEEYEEEYDDDDDWD